MSLETLRLCQEGSVLLSSPRFNKEVKSRFEFLPFPCPSIISPSSQPISKACEGCCRKVSCPLKVRRGAVEQPSLLCLPGLKAKEAFSAAASAARAMQWLCQLCFVGEKEGSEPGEPPDLNPMSKDTSGKLFQSPRKRKKGLAWAGMLHCQGFCRHIFLQWGKDGSKEC